MSDDEQNDLDDPHEGLGKYGHDPLDDIKPIDTDDYKKDKDDTFLAPILPEPESAHKRQPKSAPVSSLEEKEPPAIPLDANLQGEMDLCHKGDYVDLKAKDPTLWQVMIGAGWEQRSMENDRLDLDLTCFLLNKDDMTREDGDFIFYNQPTGSDGAVKLLEDSRSGAGEGDDERIFIDLNGLPFEVVKVMFCITIYDDQRKGLHLGQVRDIYLRVVNYDDDKEIVRFIIPDDEFNGFNGMYCAMLVREGPQWFLQPLAEPVKGGLAEIAKKYGMLIAEEAG